jgi:hypothetical protein
MPNERDNQDALLDRLCEISVDSTAHMSDDERWDFYKKMLNRLDEDGSSVDGDYYQAAVELIREIG